MSLKDTYIMTLIHNEVYKHPSTREQLYELQTNELFNLIKGRCWENDDFKRKYNL